MSNRHYGMFAIDDRPYCVWDVDIPARNREFLDMVDPNYFVHLARENGAIFQGPERIEGTKKERQYSAINLRLGYSHALETFFALVGATLQAPECAVGWVHLYDLRGLTSLVRKITSGEEYYSEFHPTPTTWAGVAKLIFNPGKSEDEEMFEYLVEHFGRLWQNFATEFVDESFSEEYNSAKHGLRVRAGGFHLKMFYKDAAKHSEEPFVKAESEFGTNHFSVESIGDRSYIIHRRHRNWSPMNYYYGLELLGRSITIVLNFLKTVNRYVEKPLIFEYPAETDYFNKPWQATSDIPQVQFSSEIDPEATRRPTREDILSRYQIRNDRETRSE